MGAMGTFPFLGNGQTYVSKNMLTRVTNYEIGKIRILGKW